jgi:hypothetical protein
LNPHKELYSPQTALQKSFRKFQNFQNLASAVRPEKATCIFQQLLTLSSRLLLKGSSKGKFYSSHFIVNHGVCLCANLRDLNPRINEIGSGGNLFKPVPQPGRYRIYRLAQCTRIYQNLYSIESIPTIFWLFNPVTVVMSPRTWSIVDSTLHVSSHLYAS